MKRAFYLTKVEFSLWFGSVLTLLSIYLLYPGKAFFSLFISLVGVTSLIYAAKGNPIGPLLMLIFSALYGYISYLFAYYGEMFTYVGMTLPMAGLAFVSWLKNPFSVDGFEVKVKRMPLAEVPVLIFLTIIVTFGFYFILKALDTRELYWSTLSITTSFVAAYFSYRRSVYFSLAYMFNDLILIRLWLLAWQAEEGEATSLPLVICFSVFLINDIYAFVKWLKMRKRQETLLW